MRRIILLALVLTGMMVSYAADPTATNYSWDECQGSARPYPAPKEDVYKRQVRYGARAWIRQCFSR